MAGPSFSDEVPVVHGNASCGGKLKGSEGNWMLKICDTEIEDKIHVKLHM